MKAKKLNLQQQANLLLKNVKNLKSILNHVLDYGVLSDESLVVEDLNLDCFLTKKQYKGLVSSNDEFDQEEYCSYVADNYAPILKSENWCVIFDTVYKLTTKKVLQKPLS